MKGKQILVVAIGVTVALFCAWNVWRLVSKLGEAAAAVRQRDAARAQLEAIYQLRPFPSETNRALAAADCARLKAWEQALGERLADTNRPPSLSPLMFMQNLKDNAQELSALASATGARLVPEGFAFGFDRYGGVEGRMPQVEDVPRLTLQLRMIDRLCRELAQAGVLALHTVRREEFETGESRTVEPAAAARGRARRPRPGAEAAAGRLQDPAPRHSTRHRFTIEFTARQNAAFDVLNRLAAMDLFVVVTDVAMRKTGEDLKAAPALPAESAAKPAKGKAEMPDAMQRLVAGPLVDPPLHVRLELDVHVFEGA